MGLSAWEFTMVILLSFLHDNKWGELPNLWGSGYINMCENMECKQGEKSTYWNLVSLKWHLQYQMTILFLPND